MAQLLTLYHSRAPRYTLTIEDPASIRFDCEKTIHTSAQLKNVSITGLAFVISKQHAPTIGDEIKIEFHVPGADQMACHACVARTEALAEDLTLVGIRFEKLNSAQRRFLTNGLTRQFEFEKFRFVAGHKAKVALTTLLLAALALCFYLISPGIFFSWIN